MNATSKKINLKNLRSDIDSLKKSLLNLNFQKSTGQLEKTSEIRKTSVATNDIPPPPGRALPLL